MRLGSSVCSVVFILFKFASVKASIFAFAVDHFVFLKVLLQNFDVGTQSNFVPEVSTDDLAGAASQMASILDVKLKMTFDFLSSSLIPVSSEVKNSVIANLDSVSQQTLDKILELDSRLKLPTTEYAKLVLDENIKPRVFDVLDSIDRSDIVGGIKTIGSKPSSEVLSKFTNDVGQNLEPLERYGKFVAGRIELKLSTIVANAVKDLATIADTAKSTAKQAGEYFSSQASTSSPPIFGVVLDGDEYVTPGRVLNGGLVNVAAQSVDIVKTAGSASLRAVSVLGSELGSSGQVLAKNIGGVVVKTGPALEKISTRLVQAPQKISYLATSAANAVSSSAESLRSLRDVTGGAIEGIQGQLEGTVKGIRDWRLFPDESHWETGYWEQQIKAVGKLRGLKSDDFHLLADQVSEKLSLGARRFAERAAGTTGKLENVINQGKQIIDSSSVSTSAKKVLIFVDEEGRALQGDLQGYVYTIMEEGEL